MAGDGLEKIILARWQVTPRQQAQFVIILLIGRGLGNENVNGSCEGGFADAARRTGRLFPLLPFSVGIGMQCQRMNSPGQLLG